jgi:adenylate kinase
MSVGELKLSPVLNVIIVGPQGSGKGTQADLLAKRRGLCHLEMGRELRLAAAETTETGRLLNQAVNRAGVMAPFEIAMPLFLAKVAQTPLTTGIIFDGTPRRVEEIAYWDAELPKLGRSFTHLFALRITVAETMRRLSLRRICKADGLSFTLGVDIHTVNELCPRCGGPLIPRTDDTPRTIKRRLDIYAEETAPVIERYRDRGIVHCIDGDRSISDVAANIDAVLGR